MTTFNTGNPIPSVAPKDLFDNAQAFDEGMNSGADTFKNRVGQTQYTWARFNRMTVEALARVDNIVANVNAYAASGRVKIDESVASVDEAEAAAKVAMALAVSQLSDDLGNKGFATYAEMLAYVPKYDGTMAWVQSDADALLNGFYQWRAGSAIWVKPLPQPALTTDIDALKKIVTVRKRPRGSVSGNDALVLGAADTPLLFGVHRRLPRGPAGAGGTVPMLGMTPMPTMRSRLRPRSQAITADVVLLSGKSVMLQSGVSSVSPIISAAYDAKLIQEQNEEPSPSRLATITDGKVYAHDLNGSSQITQAGTWLAASAVAFDIVRALGSIDGAARPHSILRDGRILRESNVLLHKLVTGQSLALGSRGIVPDANGEFTIDGRKGNLYSPFTPSGYTSNLFTLPGGPRPTSWVGATALDPVREFVSGVVAETPATSYMLALRRWHERSTAIAPNLLYSISAVGGVPYATLKKGTQTYSNALAHVTAGKSIATARGWDYSVPSLSIVHGESQINTTQAEYVAMQAEWIANYQADIAAITGQAVPPVAFISQMLTGEAGTIPAIPLAQLQAHNENPSIIMVGPKYAYPYFDQYHLLAEGYIKMGELEARAERLSQVSGKWQPLKVLSATVSGETITLRLNNRPHGGAAVSGPIGRLALDALTVSDPGNLGFQLSTGSIASIALGADGSSLVITASAAVVAGTVLTYALQPTLGSPQTGSGRRGCIRDTDMRDFSRFDNKPLHNWLCAFSLSLEL